MTNTEKESYLQLLTQYAGKAKGMGLIAAFGFGKQFQKKKLSAVMDKRKKYAAGVVALTICMLSGLGVITSYTYQKDLTAEETIIKYLEDPIANSHLAMDTLINAEHVASLEFISLKKCPTINYPWPHVDSDAGSGYTKFRVFEVTFDIQYDEAYDIAQTMNFNGKQMKEFILIYTKDGWIIHSMGFSIKL